MGAAIAANLVRARHDVAIWNRTADKAPTLVNAALPVGESPRAAAADTRRCVYDAGGTDALWTQYWRARTAPESRA